MANRYVWERYDDEYTLSSSSMGSTSHYFDSSDGLSINREAWMMKEQRSTPRYSSVDGAMSGDAFNSYNNFNEGDEEICYFVCLEDPDTNIVRECWGAGGDRIMVEYNDSISLRVAVSGGASNLRHYTTQRAADYDDPQGSVSSASSGAYPTDGWRSPYWYVYQGADSIDPASVTVPASIQGGTSIDITVAPSASKVYGGTVSYTYQYKLGNGAWQTLSGPTTATTQQLTIPKGTTSVQVRVQARDNLGFTSSTWVSSDVVEVTNNQPPTAPGSINVTNVVGGGQATITLTAATDPDGTIASYRYERSVDGSYFTQFADVNSLTQTDQIGEDWGTVTYRACAVDNDGAAGPYVTSETKTINSGYLLIGGPVSNMGVKSIPFDFEATVGVSGETSITGIEATMWLDHMQVYHESVNQGATLEYHVDTRVMSSGQHTIQVTLEKEDYLPANAAYYFTVPSQGLPNGGMSAQLEDDQGNPIFPRTTTRDVIGPSGKSVQNEIEDLQKAHRGTTGHLEHVDTVFLSNNGASVTIPRETGAQYAFIAYHSRADQHTNSDTNYGYAVTTLLIQSHITGTRHMAREATGYNYAIDITANANSFQITARVASAIIQISKFVIDAEANVITNLVALFTALEQPHVLTAATNTGTTATDLQDALRQIMDAFPGQNLYMIEDVETSDTVYYVACVDIIDADTTSKTCAYVVSTNPTKWYQGVQLTFVDSSNPAKNFTQLSGNYTGQITTAGTGSDKGSQHEALIALLQTNKGYYYKFTDYAGTTYYMASSTAISMSGDSVTVECDYVKNAEAIVYTGGTISFYNIPDAPNWNVGQVVTFAGLQWIVSHKTPSECYLTAQTLQNNPTWNNLQTTCQSFDSTHLTTNQKAFLKQITAGNTNGYVFVATHDQMNGDFSYFNSDSRRSTGDVYWTSTGFTANAWSVNAAGAFGLVEKSYSLRFRPSICFDLTKYL